MLVFCKGVARIKDSTPVKIEHNHVKVRKDSSFYSEQFVIDLESHLDGIHQICASLHSDLVFKDVITAINIVLTITCY